MRTGVVVLGGTVLVTAVALTFLSSNRSLPPPIAPNVEPTCVDAMRRSAPDLSWVATDRDALIRRRGIRAATLGELVYGDGDVVRVAGFLHAEFEWEALHPSRASLVEGRQAPWVDFRSLWPGEPYWRTKGPMISDRCAIVEGVYVPGPGGHEGMFNGAIQDVVRLDVWSEPHRPYITTPLPPGPPPSPVR